MKKQVMITSGIPNKM